MFKWWNPLIIGSIALSDKESNYKIPTENFAFKAFKQILSLQI